MSREARIKRFYSQYHDRIDDKRHHSPYWTRRYAHGQILSQFLPFLQPGQQMLDAGCGEGTLCRLAAERGLHVTGVDISAPNIASARDVLQTMGLPIHFCQADVEQLPFPDNCFDVVVCSHVIEHLPNPAVGLRELYRTTRDLALIAMPTCLSPACWSLLGGDSYWKFGRRTPMAIPAGFVRTMAALLRGQEGPDEGYENDKQMPHVWRFPSVMRRQIKSVGFHILRFEAGPLIIPYLCQYVPFMRRLQVAIDRLRAYPLIRNLGIGSMAVCSKHPVK